MGMSGELFIQLGSFTIAAHGDERAGRRNPNPDPIFTDVKHAEDAQNQQQ